MTSIGLPQCLAWYEHYPRWNAFFLSLGLRPLSSGPTDRALAEQGLALALDELCFPTKLAHGHVHKLAALGADYIFLPRLVSVEARCFSCPNIIGLPDMIRSRLRGLPPLLTPCIDLRRGEAHLEPALKEIGAALGCRPGRVKAAWREAAAAQSRFNALLREGYSPPEAVAVAAGRAVMLPEGGDLSVGIVGHSYCLYDPWLNLGLIAALRGLGCRVVCMEAVPPAEIERQAAALPRRIFWSSGKKMLGAAMAMERDNAVDGVIALSSMGCGPDSILNGVLAAQLKNTPALFLSVDEHSAETAMMTRLEAFCDMLRQRRKKHEHNLSPYGQPVYRRADLDGRAEAGGDAAAAGQR